MESFSSARYYGKHLKEKVFLTNPRSRSEGSLWTGNISHSEKMAVGQPRCQAKRDAAADRLGLTSVLKGPCWRKAAPSDTIAAQGTGWRRLLCGHLQFQLQRPWRVSCASGHSEPAQPYGRSFSALYPRASSKTNGTPVVHRQTRPKVRGRRRSPD